MTDGGGRAAATPGVDLVPFGKYKGQAVELLLADRSYCQWLAAQPWFRERFAPVYNIIIGAGGEPQDTPEHNAMQARYLDHAEALRIARRFIVGDDKARQVLAKRPFSRLSPTQRDNLVVGDYSAAVERVTFESGGWDLVVTARADVPVVEVGELICACACGTCWNCTNPGARRLSHCNPECPRLWLNDKGDELSYYLQCRAQLASRALVGVELKPVIGDDYPTVLRQVLRRAAAGYSTEHMVVLADRAQFAGVTLDQVRRIFATQRVTLLTTAELAPALACSCSVCAGTPTERNVR